jgi:hypothetical protein
MTSRRGRCGVLLHGTARRAAGLSSFGSMILAAQRDQDFDPTNLIQANTLPADEGPRIAANIARLSELLLRRPPKKAWVSLPHAFPDVPFSSRDHPGGRVQAEEFSRRSARPPGRR